MDFLTTEYVKQEAEKGTLEALKCSLKHHEQGRDADWVELGEAIKDKTFWIGSDECACCRRFCEDGECSKCPLYANASCCDSIFKKMNKTIQSLRRDYSNANFKAFQEAEKVLCKYIEGKIVDHEAKAKDPEVTYSIGDRFKLKDRKYIIAAGGCGVHAIKLTTTKPHYPAGEECNPPIEVGDYTRITQEEMDRIISDDAKIRYWDAQKKEYTDGRDDKKECKCKPKADLKALDKPELRHWDMIICGNRPALVDDADYDIGGTRRDKGPFALYGEGGFDRMVSLDKYGYKKVGNLKDFFDDLAAIGEKLESFEMECDDKCGGKIKFSDNGDGKFHIVMEQEGKRVYMSAVPQDLILKLRRMEPTLKTK